MSFYLRVGDGESFQLFQSSQTFLGREICAHKSTHPVKHQREGKTGPKGFFRRHHHANRELDIHVNLVSRASKVARGHLREWNPLGSQAEVRYHQENRRAHQATMSLQQCLLGPVWWQASRLRLLQGAAIYSLGSPTFSLWFHQNVQLVQIPRDLPTAACRSP